MKMVRKKGEDKASSGPREPKTLTAAHSEKMAGWQTRDEKPTTAFSGSN